MCSLTSVAPLARPVCAVRTDSLQRVLLLPESVHTLVSNGGEGALHRLTVCGHPKLHDQKKTCTRRHLNRIGNYVQTLFSKIVFARYCKLNSSLKQK